MNHYSTVEAVDPATDEKFFQNDRNFLFQLDSWGLTPDQYRVYCHLVVSASSNKVAASIESIRKTCKLGRSTVVRVLSQLLQMKLIARQTSVGKESSFILLPFEQWKKPTSTTDGRVGSKVLHMKHSKLTSTTEEPVPQTAGLEDISTPLKGVDISPPQPVPQTTQVAAGTGSTEELSDPTNLQDKLAAARNKGWIDAGTWWNDCGQQMVRVNCSVVTVQEFMQRSLDSFQHIQEHCQEGIAMFKAKIEQIKQRNLFKARINYGYQ